MAIVLVADDESSIRDVIESTCRLDGHDVRTVGTVDDAVNAYTAERPDLMILDLNMPGGGAAEILLAIEESVNDPVSPVIVVSGYAADAFQHELVVEVIQKPFGIDALRIAVKSALGAIGR